MHRAYTEFNELVTPDGKRYRFNNHTDRFLMAVEGEGMPDIDYITTQGPQQHGETIVDYRLKPRIVQYQTRRNASPDRSAYWNARSDLINHLRPNRQTIGQLLPFQLLRYLPGHKIRALDVFIDKGPGFVNPMAGDTEGFTEVLRFIASDPTFYDPTQICVVIGFLTAVQQLRFPIRFRGRYNPTGNQISFGGGVISNSSSITYTGTWPAFPTIQIVGPLSVPDIYNVTTNERIRLNYTVSAGETVTIGLGYGNKYVRNNSGVNLMGTVAMAPDLATFHLEPDPGAVGGVNVITVNGASGLPGTTQVNLAYYTRYIGI